MKIGDIIVRKNEIPESEWADAWKMSPLEFIQRYDCHIVMNIKYVMKGSHYGSFGKRLSGSGNGSFDTPEETNIRLFTVYGDRSFGGWRGVESFNDNFAVFKNIFESN